MTKLISYVIICLTRKGKAKMSGNIVLNCKDKVFTEKILNDLEDFQKEAMNFFEIDKLSRTFNVQIYDSLTNFVNFVTFNGKEPKRYHDGTVATTRNGVVHILNLELYTQDERHKNNNYDDYIKTLKHEFVHICHEEILKDKNIMPPLLMEGIATRLAGQTKYANKVTEINCSADDLVFDFYKIKNNYAYAYEIMGYLMQNKSHNDLLKILSEPQKEDVDRLIKDTNKFLKSKQNTIEKQKL